jgi:hypothetical protein
MRRASPILLIQTKSVFSLCGKGFRAFQVFGFYENQMEICFINAFTDLWNQSSEKIFSLFHSHDII